MNSGKKIDIMMMQFEIEMFVRHISSCRFQIDNLTDRRKNVKMEKNGKKMLTALEIYTQAEEIFSKKSKLKVDDVIYEYATLMDVIDIFAYAEFKKAVANQNVDIIYNCFYSKSKRKDDERDYHYVNLLSNANSIARLNTNQLKRNHIWKLSNDKKSIKTLYHFNCSVLIKDAFTENFIKKFNKVEYQYNTDKSIKNIKVFCTYETLPDTFKTLQAITYLNNFG